MNNETEKICRWCGASLNEFWIGDLHPYCEVEMKYCEVEMSARIAQVGSKNWLDEFEANFNLWAEKHSDWRSES